MKFLISDKIFEKYPELKLGVVVAENLNKKEDQVKELKQAISQIKENYKGKDISEIPAVKNWRQVYRDFNADPDKYHPSLQSLLKLAVEGKLTTINPLVDIYNAVSLSNKLPAGGEDLDKIEGDLKLVEAEGGEKFIPLNTSQTEKAKEGEIIYEDKQGVVVRRFNWKESDRTKLNEGTENAVFVLESLTGTEDKLDQSLEELKKLLEKYYEGDFNSYILDSKENGLKLDSKEKIAKFGLKKLGPKSKIEEKTESQSFQPKNYLEERVYQLLKKQIEPQDIELEKPPQKEFGDISCVSPLKIGNKAGKNPRKVAERIKSELESPEIIEKVEIAGPGYLNFFINEAVFAREILESIRTTENYGYKPDKEKTAVVEFPAPNTNKPLHIGHLRNMALGESVSRLLESQGYNVKKVNLYNDRGIHICKSMLAYKKWGEGQEPDKKPDHFVGDFYVQYNKMESENPSLEDEAREMLRKWEEEDPEVRELWKKMNEWVLSGFDQTFNKFGIEFDKVYFESDTYDKGKQMVEEGVENGIFRKNESGAVVIDLEDLGEKVLLRSDGTSVYITQDLYLAQLKYDDFKFDKSIYVVGNEQDYHFKVLFNLLNKLDLEFAGDCYHLSYGMVYLPEGRLKSREGKVIDADELMEEIFDLAEQEIKKRGNLAENQVKDTAEKIGLAAIKYFLLKFSANKDFTFQPDESLSFEGKTGPYLQYSLVRAKRIREKSEIEVEGDINYQQLTKKQETALVKKMSNFSKVLEKSTDLYSPHLLAEYSFELSSKFNKFYETCPVIDADKETKKARMALVNCYIDIIKSCLKLLGIKEVEQM